MVRVLMLRGSVSVGIGVSIAVRFQFRARVTDSGLRLLSCGYLISITASTVTNRNVILQSILMRDFPLPTEGSSEGDVQGCGYMDRLREGVRVRGRERHGSLILHRTLIVPLALTLTAFLPSSSICTKAPLPNGNLTLTLTLTPTLVLPLTVTLSLTPTLQMEKGAFLCILARHGNQIQNFEGRHRHLYLKQLRTHTHIHTHTHTPTQVHTQSWIMHINSCIHAHTYTHTQQTTHIHVAHNRISNTLTLHIHMCIFHTTLIWLYQ